MKRTSLLCVLACMVALLSLSYAIYLHYTIRGECIEQAYLIGVWKPEVPESQRGQIRSLEFDDDGQVAISIFMPPNSLGTDVHEYRLTSCNTIAIDFNRPNAPVVELNIEVLKAWNNEMIVTGFDVVMPRSWRFVRQRGGAELPRFSTGLH